MYQVCVGDFSGGVSPLQNDRDHIADIDMTGIWGPDRHGNRQYLHLTGPWPEIVNATANPAHFLETRAGIIPNTLSESVTGQSISELQRRLDTPKGALDTSYYLPNVAETVSRGKRISEGPSGSKYAVPAQNALQRALDVVAHRIENMDASGVTTAERMYERGGLPAAALSLATGVSARTERPGPEEAAEQRLPQWQRELRDDFRRQQFATTQEFDRYVNQYAGKHRMSPATVERAVGDLRPTARDSSPSLPSFRPRGR